MPLELAYEQTGAGPPLVVLHGLFGSSSNWRGIAKALGEDNQVFSVDLRNHGASPWADAMGYEAMAEDVAALVDRLALGSPAILGHSMGGKVAMTLALTAPGRVARLVVVDIAPKDYPDHFSSYVAAMRAVDVAGAASRDMVKRALLATIPDARVVDFLLTNLVRRAEGGYAWRVNLAALAPAMPVVSAFPRAFDGRRYDGPVTVIDGALSTYVEDADRARFAHLFPHVRFATIAESGHWLHADRPADFVAAVREALGTD